MVCGIRELSVSSSLPNKPYPVARDLYGSFAEARPWTPTKELLGGTLSLPRPGVAGVSVSAVSVIPGQRREVVVKPGADVSAAQQNRIAYRIPRLR